MQTRFKMCHTLKHFYSYTILLVVNWCCYFVCIYMIVFALEGRNPNYVTQKRKGRQIDSFDVHWRRWSLSSTSPVNIKAVNLTTFSFQCNCFGTILIRICLCILQRRPSGPHQCNPTNREVVYLSNAITNGYKLNHCTPTILDSCIISSNQFSFTV